MGVVGSARRLAAGTRRASAPAAEPQGELPHLPVTRRRRDIRRPPRTESDHRLPRGQASHRIRGLSGRDGHRPITHHPGRSLNRSDPRGPSYSVLFLAIDESLREHHERDEHRHEGSYGYEFHGPTSFLRRSARDLGIATSYPSGSRALQPLLAPFSDPLKIPGQTQERALPHHFEGDLCAEPPRPTLSNRFILPGSAQPVPDSG